MSWFHTSQSKLTLTVIAVGLPILFLASIPWLRQQTESVVYLFAGIAAAGTVIASLLLAIHNDQKLDEWHRSAARFSSQWGWVAGAGVVAILLAIPPLQTAIVAISGHLSEAASPDRKLVLMAFLVGFISVVVSQMICTLLLNVGWRYWMSRSE